ncbi:4Fe-4S binding protein [Neobacillus massiliamazoniensis]|uniref:Putative electron transport protein YccM n=1 Tax=Neobacillus massiliamazoniensis TaxID=1499688 RepID=A0A0U1NV74_9BACI|nr:4Fe-4S binding protein [Neobacillus massiliamazoniensis]CRK81937.1 Putative electron transport protein YccM [Neobacillus massiliamazoniensis]
MKSKNWYVKQLKRKPVQITRFMVQAVFLLFLLYVGFRFYQFYQYFETAGKTPFVERPSAVEGFLPISALVALKVWLTSGSFDQIHPAGLVLFTFFVGSGIIFRKSFCGWICPVGTVSEWTGMLGKKIFKKNFEIPRWLVWCLTPLKYLLLLFFIKIIVIDMPTFMAKDFLNEPYNKIADVKMLLFFLNFGGFTLKVILVLFVLSLFFKNFWCRFLCPYGALIGLGSIFRITKVHRNEATCTNCEMCTKACPQRIKVHEKEVVATPDCTACMSCVEACPIKDTLNMTVIHKKVNKWFIPVSFFVLFIVVVSIAKITGHWDTVISFNDWKELIPTANDIGH